MLSSTDDRGNRDQTAWRQSIHPTGYAQWVLAGQTIGRVVLLNNVSHSLWQIPIAMETDAISCILSARSFPRKMHEFAEGLAGIEGIADDFLFVGFGDSYEEAARDNDKNLLAFLKCCEDQDIHLSPKKMKLGQDKVLLLDTWYQLRDSELTLLKSLPSQRRRHLQISLEFNACSV